MTQEEKSLLLKDLCARLPYSVKCHEADVEYTFDIIGTTSNNKEFVFSDGYERNLEQIKPYLRPMSSMTDDEKKELLTVVDSETEDTIDQLRTGNCGIMEGKYHFNSLKEFDWLNAHYFDYRGLIEKGLALQAPEGIYNLKKK